MASSHLPPTGLTSAEANTRLAQYGYNEVTEAKPNALITLVRKFWAPVPWMLEATILLTLLTARYLDAAIIGFLLVFNIIISFLQEGQAERTLALLRQRLSITARVLRDGQWRQIAARELAPGDVIHVRMGDVIPADTTLLEGALVVDQSALTGESVPVEQDVGATLYAGAIARHGEATGSVTATGAQTRFGRATELVKTAHTSSRLEQVILRIVTSLVVIDAILVLALVAFALAVHYSLWDTLPFALIVLVASVPVALPATFTLAQALGARELAGRGVLITRLSAIEEAASMDVLCADKTGTITLNQLTVGRLKSYPPFSDDDLLTYGAIASDAASQDPLDLAVLAAYQQRRLPTHPERLTFTPFDPALKRTEATVLREGTRLRAIKGAPQVVMTLVASGDPAPPTGSDKRDGSDESDESNAQASLKTPLETSLEADVATLAATGYRVLAVAAGPANAVRLIGLIGLFDPPRPDSASLIASLHALGVRTKMLTGDTVETARAIASQVGIGDVVCDATTVKASDRRLALDCDVYAGIFPEDKFHLVETLQARSHVVGMTGDGVNDAPALKQAEVGIAVSTATDVAKSAASMVLTTTGLLDILAAIEASRRVYRRLHSYTLNKITKTIQVAIFLTLAFFLTRTFVLTPTLIVLLLFANDFVTMSLAADQVTPNAAPDRWQVRRLVGAALALSAVLLVESFLVLWLAVSVFHQSLAQSQTLIFLMLVFSGQSTVYVVRESRWFWSSLPGRALLIASACDLIVVSLLAGFGLLMAPVRPLLIVVVLLIAAVFTVLLAGVNRLAQQGTTALSGL